MFVSIYFILWDQLFFSLTRIRNLWKHGNWKLIFGHTIYIIPTNLNIESSYFNVFRTDYSIVVRKPFNLFKSNFKQESTSISYDFYTWFMRGYVMYPNLHNQSKRKEKNLYDQRDKKTSESSKGIAVSHSYGQTKVDQC